MASEPDQVNSVPVVLLEENGRLKRRVADLLRLARTDALTGVCNRAFLLQELSERAALHRVRGLSLGLAVIDADNFKVVNDTFGHQAGDLTLQTIAQTLQNTLRESDLVGRFGGEEFVAILEDSNAEGLAVVGERMRSAIERAVINFEGRRIAVTVSIGLAEGPVVGTEKEFGERLFAAADAAMYRAKNSGRNCFVVESLVPDMDETLHTQLSPQTPVRVIR